MSLLSYRDQRGWSSFLELCAQASAAGRLEMLLELLLTIDEQQQLAARCRILQELLAHRLSQREMAAELRVSIAQITRGSNALKSIRNPWLREFLQTHLLPAG
jgi:TrpR family trp operon transcriptional repressor